MNPIRVGIKALCLTVLVGVCFFYGHILEALPLRFISNYSFADGRGGRTSHETDVVGIYRYYEKNQIEMGYAMVGKSYSGLETKYDRYLKFGHTLAPHDSFYFYSAFETNMSQHYGADWLVFVEPHYLPHQDLDFSLGAKFSSYPVRKSFALIPQWRITLVDGLTVSIRTDISIKPERTFSGEGGFEVEPIQKLTLKVSGGGGKTDEGDALIDDFYQISSQIKYTVIENLRITAMTQFYRGDLRRENRYGLGLDSDF